MKIFVALLFLILYINEPILNSFEYTENSSSKKWHTTMYSPYQNFFNSIWLTNSEFGFLVHKGYVKTKYKGKSILIKII